MYRRSLRIPIEYIGNCRRSGVVWHPFLCDNTGYADLYAVSHPYSGGALGGIANDLRLPRLFHGSPDARVVGMVPQNRADLSGGHAASTCVVARPRPEGGPLGTADVPPYGIRQFWQFGRHPAFVGIPHDYCPFIYSTGNQMPAYRPSPSVVCRQMRGMCGPVLSRSCGFCCQVCPQKPPLPRETGCVKVHSLV